MLIKELMTLKEMHSEGYEQEISDFTQTLQDFKYEISSKGWRGDVERHGGDDSTMEYDTVVTRLKSSIDKTLEDVQSLYDLMGDLEIES